MSKIIKIQSLKNSSSVLKVKTVANEKYIIVDETGKPLNKLKFVQKDKNLEIYTDVDGKEQQIVTLEDYYAPDMNASVVGLDETSEELAYIYNANDGWSYLELEDTAFGFATPLLGIGAAGAAGAGIAAAGGGGGNGGNDDNNTNTAQADILSQIGNEGDKPDSVNSVVTAAQLASLSGITGVINANEDAYQDYIDANPDSFSSPATLAEVQAMITAVNTAQADILSQIGNEGDKPDSVNSVVTAAQLASLSGITGVINANEDAYQDYIDANPDSFSSPATLAEVQAMITAVNTAQADILSQIGNEGDKPDSVNSVVTAAQLASLSGITGVINANEDAYQDYIDANPDSFSSPATLAEVQAMITAVNTAQADILSQIGNEGDKPDSVNSVVTAAQLASLSGITGVINANEDAYQDYIDANPDSFSSPATLAEVQAMITAVNTAQADILSQIGNEGDKPDSVNSVVTAAQLASLSGITGVINANEDAYQDYIDANPDSFSSPATLAEVQAMITAVNTAQADILSQIGNEGDKPDSVNSVVTAAQLASLSGITGVINANEDAYQDYIDANPDSFSSPATLAEVQAMITAVNTAQADILSQIGNEGDKPDSVNSVVTAAQLASLSGITGVINANEDAYQDYIDANPDSFASPATLAEVQAMITAVNALEKIANYADSNANPAPTVQDYIDAGITGVDAANLAAVNAKVDAVAKTDADTVSKVQALADAGNTTADTALEKIANYADSNTNPAPTVQDYIDAGITGVDAANLAAVNAKVDAVAKTDADTVSKVQALADAGNTTADTALEKIANYADDSNTNPAPTVQDYIDAGITGVDAANLAAVNAKVDAVAKTDADTVSKVQALADAGNTTADTALEKIANYADSNTNPAPTVQDYIDAGITGVDAANLAAVNAKVDAVAKTDADTVSKVQALADAGNTTADTALEKIANYADDSNTNPAPTVQDYIDAGITGVDAANLAAVNAKVDAVAKTDADTVPEVQALADAGNTTADTALEKIANYADDSNTNPAPTVQDYIDAGITGVDAANLAAVNAKVDAVAKTDADTVSKVQALADAGNTTADTALEKIANYADDSNTNPAPTVQDYIDAGITGVDAANLAAVNAKVDAVAKTDADTVPEIQAIADSAKVLSIQITSATGNQNSYLNAGDTVTATVTMSEIVNITGTPQLAFNIGGAIVQADYVNGTGTNTLTFTYSVLANQTDADGISIDANSLSLNGGTIQDVDGTNAILTTLKLSDNASYLVDTSAPSAPVINTIATDDIINSSEQSSVITGTNEAGATVSLSIGGTTRAATVTGTTWSYTLVAADIIAMGQGAETITATQTDVAGNVSASASKTITVDTSAPIFSSTGSATTPENVSTSTTVYDANATDNGGAVDAGITYTISGTDASLFNINSAGEVKFNASPNFEAPDDSGADNTYDITIKATDVTGNYTTQNVAIGVTDVAESLAGQSVIDLGADGKLINGVQVEGKWYYYWDKSGDGTTGGTDYVSHDLLDGIFNHDVNGVTNTTVANNDGLYGTTDTYRYGTINGVSLALPTYGGTGAFTTGYRDGTEVSLNTETDNTTYDDLLAIWDSFNGTGTGSSINGVPSDWLAGVNYWSASPTSSGHANVYFNNGSVGNNIDTNTDYVVLEVLFDTKSPLFSSTTTATIAENAAISTVVYDANATDNGGAVDAGITYTISGTDASLFNINSAGEVKFNASPNFEAPADSGADNTYDITIKATDVTGNYTTQNVAISVTDVALGPVVIDLDGDGTISYTQKIMDVNSDGILDKTAWVDSNDGVLIWDKYQDGKVHDSSQYELSQYGGNTDLEGLAIGFDSNYDGVFDQKDEKFAQFSIWQDLNNDGMSQDGELKTLADRGINSINLTSDGITRTDDAGVIEAGRTIATKTDGSEVVIGDAGFEYTTAQDDSIFASLQIWVDANVDGKTNSEELYKLEDLNSQNTSSVDNGNIQGLVSNWTDTDDNSHEMVDVWFKTQEVSQNTISDTSAWTTSTVSEVNNQSYVVYANTQIVIDEEAKSQNII